MSGRDKPPSEDEQIKKILQDSFGMSIRECLKEYEDAEEHPDLSPELKAPSNGYQRIKDIIDLENIPSADEVHHHKVVRLKRILRPLVAVAIIGSVIWASGIGASGHKFYGYRPSAAESERSDVVWDNDNNLVRVTSEEEAYEEIHKRLGIDVICLSYKNENMRFSRLLIVQGHANMEFYYKDSIINLFQIKANIEKSDNLVSDRSIDLEVYNEWLQKDISIRQNVSDNGKHEYEADVEINGVIYHLSGIVDDKEEFIKVVKGLCFYKK